MLENLSPVNEQISSRLRDVFLDPGLAPYGTDDQGNVVTSDMRSLLRDDPTRMYAELLDPSGKPSEADPWQKELIETYVRDPKKRSLVCCSRQAGKSACAAALALYTAVVKDEATVLIISRALRQSAEVLRKVRQFYYGMRGLKALGLSTGRQRGRLAKQYTSFASSRFTQRPKAYKPVGARRWKEREEKEAAAEANRLSKDSAVSDSVLSMEFSNGSRIISLPCKSETIVGYSAISLLVLDEAARIPDETYHFLSPTRAVSQGGLVALSTPFGKRGWFWEGWQRCEEAKQFGKPPSWNQVKVTADDCPRIDKGWLEEERRDIGERWFSQEYLCHWVDTIDSVFAYDDVRSMFADIPVARYDDEGGVYSIADIPLAQYD